MKGGWRGGGAQFVWQNRLVGWRSRVFRWLVDRRLLLLLLHGYWWPLIECIYEIMMLQWMMMIRWQLAGLIAAGRRKDWKSIKLIMASRVGLSWGLLSGEEWADRKAEKRIEFSFWQIGLFALWENVAYWILCWHCNLKGGGFYLNFNYNSLKQKTMRATHSCLCPHGNWFIAMPRFL